MKLKQLLYCEILIQLQSYAAVSVCPPTSVCPWETVSFICNEVIRVTLLSAVI